MKVIIDGIETEFVSITRIGSKAVCSHFECIVKDHSSAHSFNQHPKYYPKDIELKTNGCIYNFPSK